jgi:hypothetical protein
MRKRPLWRQRPVTCQSGWHQAGAHLQLASVTEFIRFYLRTNGCLSCFVQLTLQLLQATVCLVHLPPSLLHCNPAFSLSTCSTCQPLHMQFQLIYCVIKG